MPLLPPLWLPQHVLLLLLLLRNIAVAASLSPLCTI